MNNPEHGGDMGPGNATSTVNVAGVQPAQSKLTSLPFDEEAKLVYGVVLSLRNMVKKISGR